MASTAESNPTSIHFLTNWRLPGVDFDLDGQESTLQELLRIGGFFPLAAIKDRLPFSVKTIRRWAGTWQDALSDCVVPVRGRRGKTIITLVHLNRLDGFLAAQVDARAARDAKRGSSRFGNFVQFTGGSVAG